MATSSSSNLIWARAGAVAYVLWGILHIESAIAVFHLGATVHAGAIQGRVYQDAWNLLFFGIAGISLAVTLNWRNSVWGYWINLGVISLADTGFIFFVLVPGWTPLWPGLEGPILWVVGWTCTTLALGPSVVGFPRTRAVG